MLCRRKSVSFLEVDSLKRRNKITVNLNPHEILNDKNKSESGLRRDGNNHVPGLCSVELGMVKMNEMKKYSNDLNDTSHGELQLSNKTGLSMCNTTDIKSGFAENTDNLIPDIENNVTGDVRALNSPELRTKIENRISPMKRKDNMTINSNVTFTDDDVRRSRKNLPSDDSPIPDISGAASTATTTLLSTSVKDKTLRMNSTLSTGRVCLQ